MEKQGVPMNQYPTSPDAAHQQPPTYHQDPNAQAQFQQSQMYQQPTGQSYPGSPPPQQYVSTPPPQQEHQGQFAPGVEQKGATHPPQNPGMPPQQQSGTVYQNAVPLMNLNRSPAPVDCPACGQRAMTATQLETGNTTHAWALGLCCFACLGCIPYMMSSMKDVQHKCGRCGVLLATWHRSGTTEQHIHS
ncbi:hypothetical protein PMIN04_006684 [Paraphaeosphaeria minitans]|uniref:LITAF-like zinc finger domain-containing protein n=1 Tax=Paraphaeosphaeria minitans TaxID=565426 RepID=A0A9P6GTR3_9PLEO|nr:LITAF-like zinc finger domain-containing protein [Paraphaeosphaeria minitans]